MVATTRELNGLTAEQIEFFNREGYLVAEGIFSDADLQPVIDEINGVIDEKARQMVTAGELSRTYEEEDFEHRLACISKETDKIATAIWNGTLAGPAFFNLIRHPRLLDIAEQMCGPELIASSVYRLRPKIPHHKNGPVPWHQDSGYFEPYCDNALVLTVWLPLVDATPERGCMWAIPRAHRGEVVKHGFRGGGKPYLAIPDEALPKTAEPVCCPVKKGGALFLYNKTPHASFENETDVVRWSMDLRYQSASLPTNAPITRLPDEDVQRPGNDVPPACYPPEADFLIRSQKRPDQVVTDPAEFHRIRTQHLTQPVSSRWSK